MLLPLHIAVAAATSAATFSAATSAAAAAAAAAATAAAATAAAAVATAGALLAAGFLLSTSGTAFGARPHGLERREAFLLRFALRTQLGFLGLQQHARNAQRVRLGREQQVPQLGAERGRLFREERGHVQLHLAGIQRLLGEELDDHADEDVVVKAQQRLELLLDPAVNDRDLDLAHVHRRAVRRRDAHGRELLARVRPVPIVAPAATREHGARAKDARE